MPSHHELCLESVSRLSAQVKSRALSPRELTEANLKRAREGDPATFIVLLEKEIFRQARELESELYSGRRRSSLHGIPAAIKNNIAVAGLTIRAGSGAFDRHCPEDASVVERLRRAGAIIMGTTNMHELGHGVTGKKRHFGKPLNPWGMELMPGGSSSGSSVAVSAGLCGLALGSDTAGSVRIPAAFCGNLSLKPTNLALPGEGLVPLCPGLDTVGLHARSAADLELGFRKPSCAS